MPDELPGFQTAGPSWSERATLGELRAVLSPTSSERRNRFLHGANCYCAKKAAQLFRRAANPLILDFGCGNGRFLRFFGDHGFNLAGTEVTQEMLAEARRIGVPPGTTLHHTDGIGIPLEDRAVDGIWCCGVLRYSLFTEPPAYQRIASEMWRVLKPGGCVVNVEMYVDSPPEVFTAGFEQIGFETKEIRIAQRYNGAVERKLLRLAERLPPWFGRAAGTGCAAFRYHFDRPSRRLAGLRDYYFVWKKSDADSTKS